MIEFILIVSLSVPLQKRLLNLTTILRTGVRYVISTIRPPGKMRRVPRKLNHEGLFGIRNSNQNLEYQHYSKECLYIFINSSAGLNA